ncbi:hypothetical protein ABPG74_022032 [Tetrahymena malaccensis]
MDCLITKNENSEMQESQVEVNQNSDKLSTNLQFSQLEQQTQNDEEQAKPEPQKQVIESDFIKNLRMLREQQKEKIDSFKQQKVELQQKKQDSELQAFEKFKEEQILKSKENQDQKNCSKNSDENLKKKIEEKAKILLNDNLIKTHESLFLRKPIEKKYSQPANLKKKKKNLPTDIKYSLLIQQHINQKKNLKSKFIRKPLQQSKKAQVYKGEGETVFVYKQPPKHPKEIEEQEQKRSIRVYDNKADEESKQKQYKKLVSDEEVENKSNVIKQKKSNQITVVKQNQQQQENQEQKQLLKEQKLNPKDTFKSQISDNQKQNDFQQQQSKPKKLSQVVQDNQQPSKQKQTQNQQEIQNHNKKSEQNQLPQKNTQIQQESRENKIQTEENTKQNENENYIPQKLIKNTSDRESTLNKKLKQMQSDINNFFNEENEFKKESHSQKQQKNKKDKLNEEDEFEYKKLSSKEDYKKQKQQQLHDIVSQKLSKLQLQAQSKVQNLQNQNEGTQNISKTSKYFDQRNNEQQEKIVDVNFLKKQYLDQNVAKNYNQQQQQQTDRERSRDYKYDQNKQGIYSINNHKKQGLDLKKNKNSNVIDVEDDSDYEVDQFILNNNIKNFIKTQSQIMEECQKQIMEEKLKESQENKQKETKSILKNGQNQQGKYSLAKDQETKNFLSKGYLYNDEKQGQTYKSPLSLAQTKLIDEQFMNKIQNSSNKQINLELENNEDSIYDILDSKIYEEENENIKQQNQYYDRKFKNNINLNQKNKQNVINQIVDVGPIQIVNNRPIQFIDESQIQYYDERQVNFIHGNNQNYISRRNLYDDKIMQNQSQNYDSQVYFCENPKRRAFGQDYYQFPENFMGNPTGEVNDFNQSSQFLRYQNLYNIPRSRDTINNVNAYVHSQVPTSSSNSKMTKDYSLVHQSTSSKNIGMQKAKLKTETPKVHQSQNQFLNDYFSQAKKQDRQTLALMFEDRNRFKQQNVDSFY